MGPRLLGGEQECERRDGCDQRLDCRHGTTSSLLGVRKF
jgi:hypothetical protein